MGIFRSSCGDNNLKKATSIILMLIGFIVIAYGLTANLETPKNESKKIQIKLNNPIESQLPNLEFVSGTEYTAYDDKGGTIVKLTDFLGNRINTTCYEIILNPDKSVFLDWVLMQQQWEYGNYFINFTTPNTEGIYDMEVRCFVSTKNISIGKGFHVSNANSTDILIDKVYGESYG